jgi:hypothetical protein
MSGRTVCARRSARTESVGHDLWLFETSCQLFLNRSSSLVRAAKTTAPDRTFASDRAPLLAAACGAVSTTGLEDLLVEMNAEGPATCVAAVKRARAAALRTGAAQTRRETQVIEHARHRQLPLQMRKVDVRVLAGLSAGLLARDVGIGYAGGAGRGDRCPHRLGRFVRLRRTLAARGLLFLRQFDVTLAFDMSRRLPGIVLAIEGATRLPRPRPGAAACAWRGRSRLPCGRDACGRRAHTGLARQG